MLSRRNIRIKVMQILYSMSRDEKLEIEQAIERYRRTIQKSFELYLFNLYSFTRIVDYARQDLANREAKYLPTEEDQRFKAKIASNELAASLLNNDAFIRLAKKHQFDKSLDEDTVRLVYTEFAKSEDYKEYIALPEATFDDHQKILLSLYKHCTASETFEEKMEDYAPQWSVDKSLVVGAIKKTIKALPAGPHFHESYRPSIETTKDFGEALLKKVFETDRELLDIIEPSLKNWDAERVAIIDMILLKMALCELLYFPTIPSKVTLNEFVDISKLYSTDKSKDFINGILDRLMKKLHQEGKINKEGRGLMD
jgi:N utilization substance protein B